MKIYEAQHVEQISGVVAIRGQHFVLWVEEYRGGLPGVEIGLNGHRLTHLQCSVRTR